MRVLIYIFMQGKCQNADICPYKFLDKENSIVSFDRREIETLAPSSLSNRESDQRERANRLNRRVAAGYSCDTRGTRTGFSSHWNQHEYIYTIGFADRCTYTTRAVSARALLSSLFALSIWVSASNNKRVEHCWKMGRTRRHLSMYRTYKHLLHDAFLFVCVCMESHLHNMLPISLSLSLSFSFSFSSLPSSSCPKRDTCRGEWMLSGIGTVSNFEGTRRTRWIRRWITRELLAALNRWNRRRLLSPFGELVSSFPIGCLELRRFFFFFFLFQRDFEPSLRDREVELN